MAKRAKGHDFMAIARRTVEQAIGEQLDGSALPDPNQGKKPSAVAGGKRGGPKGGPAKSCGAFARTSSPDSSRGGESAVEKVALILRLRDVPHLPLIVLQLINQ